MNKQALPWKRFHNAMDYVPHLVSEAFIRPARKAIDIRADNLALNMQAQYETK
jgi:hypothetical protein